MEATEEVKLTPAQAAVRAGRSEQTIQRWIREHRLPAQRDPLTRRLWIKNGDLEAVLKGQPVASVAPSA